MKEMNPNLDSIADHQKKVSVYNERVKELNVVPNERDETKKHYDECRKKRLDEFMAEFNTISLNLKEMYQMITLGGDAELELVDSLDPFSEGVVFSVRPPKESWKNVANVAGGEKLVVDVLEVFNRLQDRPISSCIHFSLIVKRVMSRLRSWTSWTLEDLVALHQSSTFELFILWILVLGLHATLLIVIYILMFGLYLR